MSQPVALVLSPLYRGHRHRDRCRLTVKDVNSDNFGLLIAYMLPGFVALWGLRPFVPGVDLLFTGSPETAPSVGGFLYGTLGSTAAGLIVSAVRWAVVDQLYHRTGIPTPQWDFGKLSAHLPAFESHVRDHYRYYQFYSNMLVAVALAYGVDLAANPRAPHLWGWPDLAVFTVLAILVLGSRDALRKYYSRTAALIASLPRSPRRRTGRG